MSRIYDALRRLQEERERQRAEGGEGERAGAEGSAPPPVPGASSARRWPSDPEGPEPPPDPTPAQSSSPAPVHAADLTGRFPAPDGLSPLESLIARAEAVLRFAQDLEARFGGPRAGGIGGLLALHERLRRALAAASVTELDQASAQIDALTGRLRETAEGVRLLKSLKRVTDADR